jgi:hypothetical protein
MIDEALEDAVVVQQFVARLVVDLEADDRGVIGVPAHDLPDDPLGVEPEGRMGEVDLLPRAPGDPLPGLALTRDLGILPGQPRRYGVGGRAQQDRDPAFVRAVQDGLQPVEVEASVLRLPRRPDGFADADDREVRLRHEVEVGLEAFLGLVFVVVGGTEEHAPGSFRHLGLLSRNVHALTPPADNPDCQ